MKRRRVGIFGGSFNPVHAGHMMVAAYVAEWTPVDEVWLSLSPANPLKHTHSGATDADRMAMLRISCSDSPRLRPCDVELSLPHPSYTIHTLRELRRRHPDTDFTLIIGADNWLCFDRWLSPQEIISDFGVMVYPRPGFDVEPAALPEGVTWVDAPLCSLSSTFIRHAVATGHRVNHLVPAGVEEYITHNRLYLDEQPSTQQ